MLFSLISRREFTHTHVLNFMPSHNKDVNKATQDVHYFEDLPSGVTCSTLPRSSLHFFLFLGRSRLSVHQKSPLLLLSAPGPLPPRSRSRCPKSHVVHPLNMNWALIKLIRIPETWKRLHRDKLRNEQIIKFYRFVNVIHCILSAFSQTPGEIIHTVESISRESE